MFRRCIIRRYTVHSPKGVNFNLSADDAMGLIKDKYGSRWFGAQVDFLNLHAPTKEFLPFYLCSGHIHGVFTGTVSYSESGGASTKNGGTSGSSTRYVHTSPLTLDSIFEENQTQAYAGYKYNMTHVHYALKSEEIPIKWQKMTAIDTTDSTINLFEQSTSTMKSFLEEEVRRQATETATAMVRSYHPNANSVSVSFSEFTMKVDDVTPCFVPCYVTKALYDSQEYNIYVSGMSGKVGGPYLLNALYIGRAAALSTLALGVLLTPNKVAGFFFGSFASVFTYYAAFFAAKWFPSYRRDRNRRQREELRAKNVSGDQSGFRPSSESRRINEEYRSSSYWDDHKYQRRWTRRRAASSGDSSDGASSSSSPSSSASASSSTTIIRDVKGYYKTLGLLGGESVNEIRSSYRKVVLQQHPDVGGSTEAMAKANEAYRVLRDPKRRAEYDRL